MRRLQRGVPSAGMNIAIHSGSVATSSAATPDGTICSAQCSVP